MNNQFKLLGKSSNFLGIPVLDNWEEAEVIIIPLPLELTTTYMKGTRGGPGALLEASHQVELFDEELEIETFRCGILTREPMNFADSDPERAVQIIEDTVSEYLRSGKKLVFLGGEHSVTVGVVRAFAQKDSNLSVLHLDAHADLRESYQRSRFNHACVTARLLESCPVVSVGIRSMSVEEFKRIQGEELSVYTVQKIRKQDWWMEAAVSHLTDRVYITIDLDVFDPYIVPGVGTPEPGGMRWEEVLAFLRLVFKQKQVVGFDVVELSPRAESDRSAFIAAKLIYRLIGYWTVEG